MENRNNTMVFPGFGRDVLRGKTGGGRTAFPESTKVVAEGATNIHFPLFDYCLVDHSFRQFACIHGHCLMHDDCFKNGLFEKNLKFQELYFHVEDRMRWCNEIFPDIMKFIHSESVDEFADYRFIFNHRYFRSDGSISQFMHEGAITFSHEQVLPSLNLSLFLEIADIKTEDTIILNIFRYYPNKGYRKILTKEYGKSSHPLLSDREMEIIRLCHAGLSSKMIADKLRLSIHTIKNHKRHCMAKTSTHNISELIHLCLKNSWL